MNIKDRIRIFDYVKKMISNNTKPRLFIELDIPCSKDSDAYGCFMFDIKLEIIDAGYYLVIINPAGASDTSHTVVHLFLFSNPEDKIAFQDAALNLHKEVDKKVLDMFNSGGISIRYKEVENDIEDTANRLLNMVK